MEMLSLGAHAAQARKFRHSERKCCYARREFARLPNCEIPNAVNSGFAIGQELVGCNRAERRCHWTIGFARAGRLAGSDDRLKLVYTG
jgi:hypothetical protein